MKNVNVVFGEVMRGLSDVEEIDGKEVVTAFDIDGLTELIDLLRAKKTELKEKTKEAEKDAADKAKAENAVVGKAYYNSLKVGDAFSYKDSKGKIYTVTKIETKSKSGLSAACKISLEDLAEGKTKRERFPKFHQVIVPADFQMVA